MKGILFIAAAFLCTTGFGQTNPSSTERPKLVVALVVDQMRQDYLYRFYNKFGEGGFKELLAKGYSFQNVHYNYIPTETAPGHASIFTGAPPAIHGVVSNQIYSRDKKKEVDSSEDDAYTIVGGDKKAIAHSPRRMLTTTVSDELKTFTQKRSKVYGISFKPRGAIYPAGHFPDGSYWFDSNTGRYVTSTYYAKQLPEWLEKFNAKKLADQYLDRTWAPLLPLKDYVESRGDRSDMQAENLGSKSSFPYDLKALRKSYARYNLLEEVPFANDYLVELAKDLIPATGLGKDVDTDFLSISFSSMDYIGHRFGPGSVEIQDAYLRLDRSIAELLQFLDKNVGSGNYLVCLTSDHGVMEIPQLLIENSVTGGYFPIANVEVRLKEFLNSYYPGKDVIEHITNRHKYFQVYFNQDVFSADPKTAAIEYAILGELVSGFLMNEPGVAYVYQKSALRNMSFDEQSYRGMAVRGYHPRTSGDMIFSLEAGWNELKKGTDHTSSYTYDTHVPLIFYGWNIKPGTSVKYHPITDIAPTLSVLLKISMPNASIGQPIEELFK